MKVSKRFGIGVGAAAFLAGTALVAGGGAALASPQSPVFPEFTTQQCTTYSTEPAECTYTLLTIEQTRALSAAGVPQLLGGWFGAESAFKGAAGERGQGCVSLGIFADGKYIAVAYPSRLSVEHLKCV